MLDKLCVSIKLAAVMGKDIGIAGTEDIVKEIDSLPAAQHDAVPASRAFNPVHYKSGETADDSYPLNMVLRDMSSHSGSMSTRSKSLSLVASEALLEINGNDAERFGISDNGHVRLTSRRGTAYLRASVSGDVPDGIVYVPAHFSHSGVSAVTRLSGNGGISMDAVRVETS